MAHASQQETQDIIYVALLINAGGRGARFVPATVNTAVNEPLFSALCYVGCGETGPECSLPGSASTGVEMNMPTSKSREEDLV